MAQTKFRANLSAANIPWVSDFWGRSVIVPQYDENYLKKQRLSGEDSDLDIGIPQIYYGHNIMPTSVGFKSVAYSRIVPPVAPAVSTFAQMIPVKDPSENKGFIGITTDSRVFIYTSGDSAWTEITSVLGGWTGTKISYAYANGYTYICFSLYNVYIVDVLGKTLTAAVLSGITNSLVVGLTASSNYLILYDAVQVYWSSATNPNDFVPSLATGAGSGVPQDVNGQIVACLPFNNGFAIYTTTNIVLGSFSGNTRFPWIFRGAANSSGIATAEHVTFDGDQGTSYAWTSAGLLKVSPSGCTAVSPDATDFLAGRIFEDYDSILYALTTQYLNSQLTIKIAYIAARYLVMSYGVTSLTHAIVLDTALKRWGKLKIAHVDVFEVSVNASQSLTWAQLSGAWDAYSDINWEDLITLSNVAADPKRTMGFLQNDGTVKLLVWDYGNFTSDAVLILGKYQITRTKLCAMQGYDVENVDLTNSNFSTRVATTLDGKTTVSPVLTPTLQDQGSLIKRYDCRAVGMNHSIIFQGAFNLTSVLLAMTPDGRR